MSWTDWKNPNPNVQTICGKVKLAAERRTGKDFPTFEALKYRTQVGDEAVYEIMVYVGRQMNALLEVYSTPLGKTELTGIRLLPRSEGPE